MFFCRCYVRNAVMVLLSAGVIASTAAAQSPTGTTRKSRKPQAAIAEKAQPEQPATPAAPPPPPPTPEQMAPRPPTVSYQNGQLSIVAPNSTLSDILQAVKAKTGANIEIPPGANERVISRFGPGPARDVLAALLNGSHFNYVMIGTDANPTAVAQVILTPRVGGDAAPSTQTASQPNPGMPQYQYPGQPPQPQPFPNGQAPVAPVAGADQPAPETEEDDAAAEQEQNTNGEDTGGAPEQANQGVDGQPQDNGPQVKTPEQLLQELQRQQQIQQQQQQQQQPQGQADQPVQPPPQ